MFAKGRFGNVVSDYSNHSDAFFSFFGSVSFSFTRNKRERNEHERRKLCLCLTPPPLVPPLTEVNLTGEGNATPALRSRSDANVTFAPHPYTPHPTPVLDLLHAHGDSTRSLRLSSLVPLAFRTNSVSSVRKSALPHRGQSVGARE